MDQCGILDLPAMDISGAELSPEQHDISAEDIHFSYGEKPIINGITLDIPERTTTAIVGPSGGGKTTLCHLLSRFWDVDGGRQRLSIARAIMKDAPIIILDEATANVDPENEKELMEAITELTQEKTVIMIAHRLKTVRRADQILVVDNGQIVQRGTHDELMGQDGIYRRFISGRKQAVGWKI